MRSRCGSTPFGRVADLATRIFERLDRLDRGARRAVANRDTADSRDSNRVGGDRKRIPHNYTKIFLRPFVGRDDAIPALARRSRAA